MPNEVSDDAATAIAAVVANFGVTLLLLIVLLLQQGPVTNK